MHARVVRFTDVDAEKMRDMRSRIDDGPPEGVPVKGLRVIHDEEQQTAIVVQSFESAEDMQTAESFFNDMDPGDTPGTRASVDRGEVLIELDL